MPNGFIFDFCLSSVCLLCFPSPDQKPEMCLMCQHGHATGPYAIFCGLHYLTLALGFAIFDFFDHIIEFIIKAAVWRFIDTFSICITVLVLIFALTAIIGILGLRANSFVVTLVYTIRTGVVVGYYLAMPIYVFIITEYNQVWGILGIGWLILYGFIFFVDIRTCMYLKSGPRDFLVQSNFIVAQTVPPQPQIVLIHPIHQ